MWRVCPHECKYPRGQWYKDHPGAGVIGSCKPSDVGARN